MQTLKMAENTLNFFTVAVSIYFAFFGVVFQGIFSKDTLDCKFVWAPVAFYIGGMLSIMLLTFRTVDKVRVLDDVQDSMSMLYMEGRSFEGFLFKEFLKPHARVLFATKHHRAVACTLIVFIHLVAIISALQQACFPGGGGRGGQG